MAKPKKLPEILSEEELQDFFAAIPASWSGVRNHALLRLMVGTGLRVSEALKLKMKDISFPTSRLTVRGGKGGYDRVAGLGVKEVQVLKMWLALLGDISPEKYIFVGLDRKKPVTRRYVHELVTKLAKAAGIEKRVHPHTLRHTFGTMHYRMCKDIRATQEAMGHAKIDTTMRYTKIEAEDVVQSMVALSATFNF